MQLVNRMKRVSLKPSRGGRDHEMSSQTRGQLLIVTRALPSFEGVESGKNYEKKGEEEANHDFILNTRTYKDLLGSLQGKDH